MGYFTTCFFSIYVLLYTRLRYLNSKKGGFSLFMKAKLIIIIALLILGATIHVPGQPRQRVYTGLEKRDRVVVVKTVQTVPTTKKTTAVKKASAKVSKKAKKEACDCGWKKSGIGDPYMVTKAQTQNKKITIVDDFGEDEPKSNIKHKSSKHKKPLPTIKKPVKKKNKKGD